MQIIHESCAYKVIDVNELAYEMCDLEFDTHIFPFGVEAKITKNFTASRET